MSLELADFFSQLVQSNPEGNDPKSRGDDHLRLIKHVLQTQFPNFNTPEAMTRTIAELNALMVKGQYGLGGAAVQITETQFATWNTGCGFYYVVPDGTGAGALPFPGTDWYALQIHGINDGQSYQIVSAVQAADKTQYTRQNQGSSGWTAWRTEWDSVNLLTQGDPFDVAGNPVMKTNSFGLGVPRVVANMNLDQQVAAFAFRMISDTFVNKPSGASPTNGILEWCPSNAIGSYGRQTFTDTNFQRQFQRVYVNGTWGGWVEMPRGGVTILANPGFHNLGPLNVHWGTSTGIADEQSVTISFARPNANGTVGVFTQVIGPGESNVTFHEIDVYNVDANGFTAVHRTNASGAVAFWWFAIGIA